MTSTPESRNYDDTQMKEGIWKPGFDISNIPYSDKKRLESYGFKFEPILDSNWRKWVRIQYPEKFSGNGWEVWKQQVPIRWTIDIEGDTNSIKIIGPLPLWTEQQFVQIFTTDTSWQQWVASITIPQSPKSKLPDSANVWDFRLADVLRPETRDWQSIVDNTDNIMKNINTLNPQQLELFQRALKYAIENNGSWLEVVALDRDVANRLYVKFWINHSYYRSLQSELQNPLLQKNGPRYIELMKRLGQLTNVQPFSLDVTSGNWRQLNFSNPEWNKPLPQK
jgi:hypothetical protein